MAPQLEVGGGTPNLRKLGNAAAMMTRVTEKVATTVVEDSTLGRICCQRMQESIPLI
jgi:hypothetical protein